MVVEQGIVTLAVGHPDRQVTRMLADQTARLDADRKSLKGTQARLPTKAGAVKDLPASA